MREVMLYEETYLRVAAKFDRRAHLVRPVVFTDMGAVVPDGKQATGNSVHP